MNITPNYQFKINSAITNNQSTPNFFGKQGLVKKSIHTAKKTIPAAIPAGTVLAMQNGKTAQDTQFTKQQILEIFGNKDVLNLRFP